MEVSPAPAALPVLTTERLRLRTLAEADVPALLAVFGDPAVMRYWDRPPFADAADAHALLARVHAGATAGTIFQWGVTLADDDAVLGTVTLHGVNRPHRRAELGYALGAVYWGRGYAAEAVRAVLRHAFGPLGLHRIEADVDPRNVPSLRLLERAGFRREGLLRERYHVGGEIQDSLLLGLLRSEAPADLRPV